MSHMIQVNAMGDACPLPVVKTKNALRELSGAGVVETLVDNDVAVQNLTKMAGQMGCAVTLEKLGEAQFKVVITREAEAADGTICPAIPESGKNTVVAIGANQMGAGGEELGKTLLKGFIYALSQQDAPPQTILFYNGGASLTCEGSASLEDLQSLKARGTEILTCGTCLNFYDLTDKLRVGEVTNMYAIVEKMTGASLLVKP